VLGELDYAGIDVEDMSIHTPDLDDVFFALTGQPTTGAPDANHPRDREDIQR
jgi:ABC-2 type transport system ATP-binding protein